ncbi:LysR substrate-binding domain-containing protein [Aurantimonas sp. HBX-1]|uniref:LysR substrate-binding domain-containing protein n=1 Tax=Aurantimonas sp. HBX-1 TaxID=2906072 RepID=UPI001F2DDF1F|nr:LysR substrate-binding domain-containing protein [Aurantimonas sp. HBX-1]UIJ73014.1 LysR substrate-binding domain-containing protein [Aurantimonas sp. HBX-1]
MVAPVNLDMDVLRTFVTGMDLGSFAKAADRLGRSPSAVSLQLRKLEDQVGQPLVRRKGRGLVPTEAGETLIGYARRILDLNDEARLALRALAGLEGWVRIGVPQDFAESWFPTLLGRFERAHPRVRIEGRVDRGSSMVDAVRAGDLDLALTWGRLGNPDAAIVGERRVAWIAAPGFVWDRENALPLVMMDAPCAFRQAATAALDAAGTPWRQSFATTSLAGVWAAVAAGLGVTARTIQTLPPHLVELQGDAGDLPALGRIELALHRAARPANEAVDAITSLLREAVAAGN